MSTLQDTIKASDLLRDVLHGLSESPKRLACKYLYDARGSALFEQICETPAYYLTRTEVGILRQYGPEIAQAVGPGCVLVEFGSGSGLKTRLLLQQLERPRTYVPVEINAELLSASTRKLQAEFPDLELRPVAADYTQHLSLPLEQGRQVAVFFPGSTLGNFSRSQARVFLAQIAELLGPGGGLLVGVDTKKDPATLTRAYNDPEGITASFNLNLLRRLNRELGADFDLDNFRHHSFYHPIEGRIESYLVSLVDQTVSVGAHQVEFKRAEPIHTEYSYKYSIEELQALARDAGFEARHAWTDPREWFGVHYLTVK